MSLLSEELRDLLKVYCEIQMRSDVYLVEEDTYNDWYCHLCIKHHDPSAKVTDHIYQHVERHQTALGIHCVCCGTHLAFDRHFYGKK